MRDRAAERTAKLKLSAELGAADGGVVLAGRRWAPAAFEELHPLPQRDSVDRTFAGMPARP